MADEKKPKSKPSSSSGTNYETEQPVMVDTTGVDIRELLGSSAGKDFDDMTTRDFENFAASKGVVRRDLKKMSRAFEAVKKNAARQYLVDTDGFNVIQENLPLTRSGRDIGNKKGLDIGDLVGLGSSVSLLAGFASRELTNYRKEQDKKAAMDANMLMGVEDMGTESLSESAGGSRKADMPMTAASLANPKAQQKAGKTSKVTGTPNKSTAKAGAKAPAKVGGPSPDFDRMITNFHNKYNTDLPSKQQPEIGQKQQPQPKQRGTGVQKAVDFMGTINRDVDKRNRAAGGDGEDDTFLENLRTWKNFWQSVFVGPTTEAPTPEQPKQKSQRSDRDMGSGSQFRGSGAQMKANTY